MTPTKLMTIDLSQPLAPIYVDPRYGALQMLVVWGGCPLGTLTLPCVDGCYSFSAEQLRGAMQQQFGWGVWEHTVTSALGQAASDDTRLPPISVVVCTRDRPGSLERCLQQLQRLDYPAFEVVVVDNCSRQLAVAEVVARSGFRYVREERPGLDWARNRGYAEARYDIVAYIDDDALAEPGWLHGIAHGFADPEVMAVTGLVQPAELETAAQRDFERYGGMSKGFKPRIIRRSEVGNQALFWASGWGVGANMAFRRSLFEQIGGFDVALDVGTPTCGGGDVEFFYRTVARGHTLRYEPRALIRHTHRRDGASFRRLVYNNGRSFPAYLLTIARNEPQRTRAVLRFALRHWLWSWLIRRMLKSIKRRDLWTLRLALTELWGSLSALRAYRAAQQAAQQLAGR